MPELAPKNTPTGDFRVLWERISSQGTSGLPVRRRFFCDCGFQADSHARLFVHTSSSSCAQPPGVVVQWGNSLVLLPNRELAALHQEWSAYLTDQTFAQQLWAIAFDLTKLPACLSNQFKLKFFEVAEWYGVNRQQAESLWNV